MIRLLLLLGLCGGLLAAFAPIFPSAWTLSLVLGWVGGMLAEALLASRRLRAMHQEASRQALLSVIVFGFLGRLSFLFAGALVGAFAGFYPEGPFLGAAVAAFFLGESLSLPGLLRTRSTAARNGTAADSATPS